MTIDSIYTKLLKPDTIAEQKAIPAEVLPGSPTLFHVNGEFRVIPPNLHANYQRAIFEEFIKRFYITGQNEDKPRNYVLSDSLLQRKIVTAQSNKPRQWAEIVQRLDTIIGEDDYDNEDFLRPTNDARQKMEELLQETLKSFDGEMDLPKFSTVGDGNLIAQWQKGDRKLTVIVSSRGEADMYKKEGFRVEPSQRAETGALYSTLENWLVNKEAAVAIA